MTNSKNTSTFRVIERPDGILHYYFSDVSRPSMDAWFETSTRHDQEYATANRHIRRMFTFMQTLFPTPYAIQRVVKAAQLTPPELRESVAIIVHNRMGRRVMNMFLTHLPKEHVESRIAIFPDESSALAWLAERDHELNP